MAMNRKLKLMAGELSCNLITMVFTSVAAPPEYDINSQLVIIGKGSRSIAV